MVLAQRSIQTWHFADRNTVALQESDDDITQFIQDDYSSNLRNNSRVLYPSPPPFPLPDAHW